MSYLSMNIKQQNRLTLLIVPVENWLPVKASASPCWQFRGIQSVHESFFAIYWYRLVQMKYVEFLVEEVGVSIFACIHVPRRMLAHTC